VKQIVPHALILFAIAAGIGGVPEEACLVLFAGGHLLAPIWAARIAPRGRSTRAFVLGPGLIIAVHALIIAAWFVLLLGGFPEDTWIALMLLTFWAAALAGYIIYCAIAFGIAARTRR
jgi:hypothetical protein